MPSQSYDFRRSGCYLGESAALNIINEEIIVASGAGVLYPGRVIALVTDDEDTDFGKYVAHDPVLTNGGQTASAILFHKVDATSADVTTVATKNGPATINGNDLEFKSGISATDKAAAIEALRALGLKVLPQHAS